MLYTFPDRALFLGKSIEMVVMWSIASLRRAI
jgi:hypothetical protein